MKIHPTALIGGPAQWRGNTEYIPVEIDPTATVGAYTCIDAGCKRPTIIGPYVQVMKQVHIGHGVQVLRGCDIATGTVIAGEATIGPFCRIGIGALILPYVKIGAGCRIGAGAVVTHDLPKYSVVAGNPAKTLRILNQGEIKWIEEQIAEQRQVECE